MSNVVISLRSFNAAISMFVSAWSVGFLLTPILLNAIIVGFFGFPVTVPLLAICAIVGLIAVGLGIWSGYSRHSYLKQEAHKLASKYTLEIHKKAPDLETAFQKGLNTVCLVIEAKKHPVAYFKSADTTIRADLTDLVLTEEEKTLLEKNIASDEYTLLASKIIQHAFEKDTIFRETSSLDSEEVQKEEQTQILRWTKVDTFFSDAPTIFGLALIVIFLISHVFLGALIPFALLIALSVSIAYGFFSAWIKAKQCDATLKAMSTFENHYNNVVKKADKLIADANQKANQINHLISSATKLIELEGAKMLQTNIASTQTVTLESYLKKSKTLQTDIANFQLKARKTRGDLVEIRADAHLELTSKDIWRLVYSFIGGGITIGSCIYTILPAFLAALGIAPLSLPVLLSIIAIASVTYGLVNLYNKNAMIRRENWNKMDNEAIMEINNQIKNEETIEERSVYSEFKTIKDDFDTLKNNLQSAAREILTSQQEQAPQSVDNEDHQEFWQSLGSSVDLVKSRLGNTFAHFWHKTASTVIIKEASNDQGKEDESNTSVRQYQA